MEGRSEILRAFETSQRHFAETHSGIWINHRPSTVVIGRQHPKNVNDSGRAFLLHAIELKRNWLVLKSDARN